ncbi:MAG: gliding motility-associated C-terminal domain-containing protein [Bacteroidales bacterium]|nr:gliding motility-associated C-terminal domain-containing protein [Bacteroidales bacterium]
MHHRLLTWIFCFITSLAAAQTDNLFWFAAPDISSVHGTAPQNGAPIYLHITAINATTVTVSQPANPGFIPIIFDLDELEHRTIRLDALMGIDQIENYPQSLPQPPASIQKKAFKITSDPGDITVYYELDNYYNRDIFPLKGRNAFGTDFFVSTQNHFPGDGPRYSNTTWSGFVVAATENNTRIVVYPTDDWLYFNTNPGDSIVIILNEGETFTFRAESMTANRHIKGARVKSDNNIVITLYDDSMRKSRNDAGTALSFDTFGDQTIPVGLIGHEYIVMKGQVTKTTFDGGERIFITTTRPNTTIYIDGIPVTTVPDAGTLYSYEINNNYVHVEGSHPIYVNHVTGFGGELGGAVLPTIDGCTGSYSVTFTRTPNTNDAFFMNLMVRNDTSMTSPKKNQASKSFTITSGGVTSPIPENYFDYILDSTWAVLKKTAEVNSFVASKILSGNEARITNTLARFHLGVINGGTSTGCKYGYFSDYQSDFANAGIGGANAIKQKTYCSFDPIHLVASGGLSYKWTCESNPDDTLYLSSTTIADPYFSPQISGFYKFKVNVERECYGDTSLIMNIYVVAGPVAMFEVENATGCSPFTATFTNMSDTIRAVQNYWNFDTRYNTIVHQSSLSNPFEWKFPENLTDSIQEYTVRLTVKGEFGMCPNQREKVIKVKPTVKAGFIADQNIGCNPLPVHFSDTSLGVIDTLNSYWDFVNYQQTYEPNPSFTFENMSGKDTTYHVKLIVYTKFGCVDTASHPVTVHPYIKANFGVDNLTNCSPFATTVNPAGSMGVDTFKWSIYDPARIIMDSVFTSTNSDSYIFNHNDNTQPYPDTLYIAMVGVNLAGCPDTAITKRLIIYPEVHAEFSMTDDAVCDSTNIGFTNHSVGYKLLNEWDLGDGNTFIDTTGSGFVHRFFNRTASTQEYEISLITTSDYFCADTLRDTVTVYPFVKANFAVDYASNCAPLNVELVNTSKGGAEFHWDFGDGNEYTTTTPETQYHVYENNTDHDTTFYIKLRAANAHGCADSLQRSVFLFPQVVADFDFDSPDAGCNPLNVSFLNHSLGKDLDFMWDFGDRTYSASENPPPKLYKNSTDQDTTYYVTLTVANLAGCDSSLTRPVTVYSKVTADFTIAQLDSCSPFKIAVDNFSSGGITDFIWKYSPDDSIVLHDFADPDIPVFTNLTTEPEKYAVVLRTENSHGCSATKSDTVTIFPEVAAGFTADLISGCQPLSVHFTNNTNIITGTAFQWTFGDGTSSVAINPVHDFKNYSHTVNADYTVKLSATSAYGCSSSVSQTITAHPKPLADFSYPVALDCPPFEVTFTSNSQGTGLSYEWDFDNGITSTEINPTETFYNYGSATVDKNIRLVVTTDYNCTDTVTKPIGIYPGVEVDFTASRWNGCNPLEVSFDGTAINANDYYWYVDDKVISNFEDPFHLFMNNSGTNRVFNVQFRAVSVNGCTDDTTRQITVYPQPLAEFMPSPQVQDFNILTEITSVTLNNLTNSQSAWDYYWDFGDGTNSAEDAPSFTKDYTIWGDITDENRIPVNLIASNSSNPECSDTVMHYVIINPPLPQVDLGIDVYGCMPLEVEFPSTTKYVHSDSYVWDFGYEGMTSTDPVPSSITYDTAGVYIVRLNVSGDGGDNWDYKKVTVHSKPLADFTFAPDYVWVRSQTEDGTPVKFFNTTQNGSLYLWDFDDGTISTEFQPQHEYMDVGQYYVTLIAESNQGCYDTLTQVIPVIVDGRGSLTFPNAITVYPDNPADENYNPNDPDPRIFRPVAEGIEKYRLEIYNRWGELIFVSEDVNKGWNGFINDSPAKQDVYVWRVTAVFTNGKPFVKAGDLTLLIRQP